MHSVVMAHLSSLVSAWLLTLTGNDFVSVLTFITYIILVTLLNIAITMVSGRTAGATHLFGYSYDSA